MLKAEKVKYYFDGDWYDAEILEAAFWVNEDAYWISYINNEGIKKTVIAHETDLRRENKVYGPACTCGINAAGGGFHSSWCDRYIRGIKVN